MANPKYTFLLPAYKATFFAQALESIRTQSYTNFRCIVSDDCSPEDLKSIFDATVGEDSRFCYRRNAENIGGKHLVLHWNLLMDMCDTEYLLMASDDDVYEPLFLEEIDELTNKYPDVDLFRGRAKRINEDNEMLAKDILLDEYQNQIEFIHSFFCLHLIKCIANYVFRTEAIKRHKGFLNMPLAWGSDQAAAITMSEKGVSHTSSVVFSFRMSSIHISAQKSLRVRQEKTKALYLYMNFLELTIPNLPLMTGTIYEKELLNKLNNFLYHNEFLVEIYLGALRCSYHEMKRYYQYLNHMHYLQGKVDKIRFIVRWILMYNHRLSVRF